MKAFSHENTRMIRIYTNKFSKAMKWQETIAQEGSQMS